MVLDIVDIDPDINYIPSHRRLLDKVGMSEGALPFLEQSERAAMVQIASITCIQHHELPISPIYGVMKAVSFRHMAQWALQSGEKGIRANMVAPGPIYIEDGAWNKIRDNTTTLYERDVTGIH